MNPWRLDHGIYFEDIDVLIPWGTSFGELEGLAAPEVRRRPDSVHLSWPGHLVLGGLSGTVGACRLFDTPNPRAFHIYLPELHWIDLELSEAHDDPVAAHRQLRRLHDHVTSALGPATFSYPNYSRKLPGIFWACEPFLVGIGPVYGGTRLSLTIQHTAPHHAKLRDEAQRIRDTEGEGRRVNGVAWHAPFDDDGVDSEPLAPTRD